MYISFVKITVKEITVNLFSKVVRFISSIINIIFKVLEKQNVYRQRKKAT